MWNSLLSGDWSKVYKVGHISALLTGAPSIIHRLITCQPLRELHALSSTQRPHLIGADFLHASLSLWTREVVTCLTVPAQCEISQLLFWILLRLSSLNVRWLLYDTEVWCLKSVTAGSPVQGSDCDFLWVCECLLVWSQTSVLSVAKYDAWNNYSEWNNPEISWEGSWFTSLWLAEENQQNDYHPLWICFDVVFEAAAAQQHSNMSRCHWTQLKWKHTQIHNHNDVLTTAPPQPADALGLVLPTCLLHKSLLLMAGVLRRAAILESL